MKKTLIAFVAMIMVCGSQTLIFADGIIPNGTGTVADPFRIEMFENLLWVETNEFFWDRCFIQTADIDADNNGLPIGDAETAFTGTYDGQGYTVSNFSISDDKIGRGFFGVAEGASIKHVHLINCTIINDYYTGGLIGGCYNTSVDSCSVTGTISGDIYIGGLIGYISYGSVVTRCHADVTISGTTITGGLIGRQNRSCTVDSCSSSGSVSGGYETGGLIGAIDGIAEDKVMNSYSIATVSGTANNAGGFMGCLTYGYIDNCYATGSVYGGNNAGGFIGHCSDEVTNCYATGSVSGNQYVGGFSGATTSSEITCCYATGSVSGNQCIGGFIGDHYVGQALDCYARGSVSGTMYVGGFVGYNWGGATVDNCYSTGSVSETSAYGGLIGYLVSGAITDSYWDTETSGVTISAGGTGKTTAEMKMTSTYVGWDFNDTWNRYVDYNNGYPYLEDNNYFSVEPETGSSCKEMHVLNYPNPVRNRTTISYSIKGIANNETVDVRIFNLKGQLVENTRATGGSLELNTEHYTPGIYFYKVAHEKKTLTGKMMIVK